MCGSNFWSRPTRPQPAVFRCHKKCGLSNSLAPGQSDYVPNTSVMILIAARFQSLPWHAVPFVAASCPTKKSSSKTANVTKTMIISLWKALDFSIALFTVEGYCIWLQRDQNCLFVFVTCSLSLQNHFQFAWGCPLHLQLRVILRQSSWALKTSSSCLMTPRNQSLSPSLPAQSHTMARPPWTAAAESARNPKPGEDFGFGIATLVCGMKEAMAMV